MSHVDEELLSYRVIDLSLLPLLLPTETEKYSDIFLSFANGKIHEPVELRGEGDFFSSLFFFLWLRRTVPEVCYRQKIGATGTVIFSIYNEDEKLRPVWVKEVRELSKEESEDVEKISKETPFDDGKVDITALWEKVEAHFPKMNVLALVQVFDMLVSDKKEIHLEGVISIVPALVSINYLVATHKTVVWNGKKIQ